MFNFGIRRVFQMHNGMWQVELIPWKYKNRIYGVTFIVEE